MSTAIYSAIYGSYERGMRPLPADLAHTPAIVYTDNPGLVAPGWEVRHVPHRFDVATDWRPDIVDPMMSHKYWKCHPIEAVGDLDVDTSIWLDGSMEVIVSNFAERCLEALGDDAWAQVRHPARDCIYDEAAFSALLGRYEGPRVLAQAEHYRSEGHPAHWGLMGSGQNIRRHTPGVVEVGRQWWAECVKWTHQDQVSLPFLLRRNAVEDRYADCRVAWNYDLPWHQWWVLHPHGA